MTTPHAHAIDKPLRVLPDGRGLWIYPLTYGRARLCVGRLGLANYDDGW